MCFGGGEPGGETGGYSWGGPTGGHDMGFSDYAGLGGSNAQGQDPSGMGPGGAFAGTDFEYGNVQSEPATSEADFNDRNASHTTPATYTQTIPGAPTKMTPSVSLAQVMNLTQDEKNTVNGVLGKAVGVLSPGLFTGMVMAGLGKVGAFNAPNSSLGNYADNFSGFAGSGEPIVDNSNASTRKKVATPDTKLKEETDDEKKVVLPQTTPSFPDLEEPYMSESLMRRNLNKKYGRFDTRLFTDGGSLLTYLPQLYRSA